ncbi:LysM repeat protein [Arthrobacter sp. UYEF36]
MAEPSRAAPPEAPGVDADSNRYLVVAGDTVGAIASRFGVNVYDMLAANGLGAYSLIYPGQTLKLSGPPVPVPVPVPVPALAAPVPAAPALTAAVAPAVRTVFVAGAGGQAMVDRCIGPIHFTPTDAYSLFITEHDFCGGWARFSGVGVGETVVISGYGTYTATGRGQVAQGATTNAVSAVFGGFPRAILQTCIPGTNRMLLIALN